MRAHVLVAALTALFTSVSAECSPGTGNLIIVDSLGGADFQQISDAVAIASDGDTILVRPWRADDPGYYDPFTILDKDLRVVAEEYAIVHIGGAAVLGLAAHKQVVLSGLIATEHNVAGGPASPLLIQDCAGAVRVARCYWRGGTPQAFAGLGCIHIVNSEDVVLNGCVVNGRDSWALAGIAIHDSRVALYDCWTQGSDESEWRPYEGMPGLYASASYVWIERGQFKGGVGPETCPYGVYGRGGPGVLIENGSTVFTTATGFEGGPGGWGGQSLFSCFETGPTGYEYVVENSKLELLPDETRGLHVEPVVTWGSRIEVRAFGKPGETLYLRRSNETVFKTKSAGRGNIHVPGNPSTEIELGIVPVDGEIRASFSLRGLLPFGPLNMSGLHSDFNTLYIQVVGRDEANGVRYGAVVPLTYYPKGVLDSLAHVLYVDKNADLGGDGLSWETAYDDLHDAATEAQAMSRLYPMRAVEIWMTAGKYSPAPPGGDQNITFRLHGAQVFGGFTGNETSRDERDWVAHLTILTGDLDGNDGPGFANRGDNSRWVVRLEPAFVNLAENWPFDLPPAVLDGIQVEGAEKGIGVRIQSGELRNCTFQNCHGTKEFPGWAVIALETQIVDCTFSTNRGYFGAALVVSTSGSSSWGGPHPQLKEPARVHNCIFVINDGHHGAVVARPGADGGGAVIFSNCLFQANTGELGGALYCEFGSYEGHERVVEVLNSTFSLNHAISAGGIQTDQGKEGVLVVANSILWANSSQVSSGEFGQIGPMGDATLNLDYSCVMGYATLGGEGNHGLNPRFVDVLGPDLGAGSGDEDLGLSADSPCADAADNGRLLPDRLDVNGNGDRNELLPTDLAGAPRRADDEVVDTGSGEPPIVDMGALERREDS